MFYHGLSGRSSARRDAKFIRVHRPGIEPRGEHEYEGYQYQMWHTRVGITRKRDRYSLKIFDGHGGELQYLSGFATVMQAHSAAKGWIDQTEAFRRLRRDKAHRPLSRRRR